MDKRMPLLSEQQKTDMLRYYTVYEKYAVEFSSSLLADVKNHTVLRTLFTEEPTEASQATNKSARDLQKDAILNNNWLPFIIYHSEQGEIYASMGLDFRMWCEVITLTRNHLLPYLYKYYEDDADVRSALNGMNSFLDISIGIMGEAYIRKKRDIIQKDEVEIAKLNKKLEQKIKELLLTNKELAFESKEREKRAAELVIANKELAFESNEKEMRAAELRIANKELVFESDEKEKRAAELIVANRELVIQNDEKEKRAAELVTANKELVYQNEEKGKRAAEFVIANRELVFQNEEKGKRAAEFVIANRELVFQNEEKGKRAAEFVIANQELVFQNDEKEKRAAELVVANKELVFQNDEKEKRAAELVVANKELVFQNDEKEKRAAELVVANKELVFQNDEKEKRAAELVVANKELVFQNDEKEKRAAELVVANKELVFQNEEKESRTIELITTEEQLKQVNHELESFSYSVSHDLRAPLRAINGYAEILNEDYGSSLGEDGNRILQTISYNAKRMGMLIDDLLAFSRLGRKEISTTTINMNELTQGVLIELQKSVSHKATCRISTLHSVKGDYALLYQVMYNLISNAVKYSSKKENPVVEISSEEKDGEVIFSIRDNGVGFDMLYVNKLFGVFQRLHSHEEFEGTGVGLAIVYRVITKHRGKVWAEGKLDEGAVFRFSLPV